MSRPTQMYQHACWCEPESPLWWWSEVHESVCIRCLEHTLAINTEWARGNALFQCRGCKRRWFQSKSDFLFIAYCAGCKIHSAPKFVTPDGKLPKLWMQGVEFDQPHVNYAWRAHNVTVVTFHEHYSLDAILSSAGLLSAFGHHHVVRLAAHWLVLERHGEQQTKGFVDWSDQEGVQAVEDCHTYMAGALNRCAGRQ